MIKVAKEDVPQKTTISTYWGPRQEVRREYQLYMRCCMENGILKAALYYPDNLRVKGRHPSYEVYIDRHAGQFITYDAINDKWLEAKLDRLEWLHPLHSCPNVWVSKSDSQLVENYLNSSKTGYDAILDYQKEVREEARVRRYRKQTRAWDADMSLTPALP